MIQSMTAFARKEIDTVMGSIAWEIRVVNHRFLDLSFRLAEDFRILEPKIREILSAHLKRGKVDCSLRFNPVEENVSDMAVDNEQVQRVIRVSQSIHDQCPNLTPLSVIDVLKWPGVVQGTTVDLDEARKVALDLVSQSMDELIQTRKREGQKLQQIIEQKCAAMGEIVKRVRKVFPEIQSRYREKLIARLGELKSEIETARLEQELVFVAQKMDVEEEMDRLEAHLSEITFLLSKPEPVGRRLDFLMQELNREANTLGSKSADIETTHASVDMKVFIEQMREQIQNIE